MQRGLKNCHGERSIVPRDFMGVTNMDEIMQFAPMITNAILTLAVSYAGWRMNRYQKEEETRQQKDAARDKLQLSMARCILIRECNHYLRKGHAPLYALDSVTEMYEAYHELGGNGAVTGIYDEFLRLPHAPTDGRGNVS